MDDICTVNGAVECGEEVRIFFTSLDEMQQGHYPANSFRTRSDVPQVVMTLVQQIDAIDDVSVRYLFDFGQPYLVVKWHSIDNARSRLFELLSETYGVAVSEWPRSAKYAGVG